jgi:8-oxo-dGTP diphosphatase
MPVSDQGISPNRYKLIPRTLVFLRSGDSFLLLKGAETKHSWAGKYNAPGGHVERGEDVLTAARRELQEETGLNADIHLCGTVIVDAGEIGICLFVFSGEKFSGELVSSVEGTVEWVPYDNIIGLSVAEDLPALVSKIRSMTPSEAPFSAHSFYDKDNHLIVLFEK